MAGSSEDRGRRRQRQHRGCPADLRDAAEPEEGELVPGCDSDVDTDEYYNNHDYYSSSDTDETTSDCNAPCSVSVPASYGGAGPSSAAAAAKDNNNNNNGNASSSPVAAPAVALLACSICGKEFRSSKAVCGHMKVHQQHGAIGRRHERQGIGKGGKGIKRNAAAVTGGWGGTGKRGGSGCWSSKPASPPSAQSDQSAMAIAVANPKIVLQPMPLAFAASNSMPVRMESEKPNQSSVPMASGTPNLSSVPASSTMTNVSDESSSSAKSMPGDAMETVVVAAANPRTEADVVHLDAAPARAPPSPPPAEVHATSVHQQPIEPPPPPAPADAEEERVQLPHVHPHPIAPPLPGRQNPNGYTCKQCGVWFPMHQGLGGHMAGHKTRELAAVPCRRDAKPEKVHVCKICGAVFPAGVQLGGHMRKHYSGAPIVPKKKPRLAIQPLPPPALEPAPRPAVAGRVLLFGVDIGTAAGAQTPAAQEEGSSATQAPSASTSGGGEQQ